MLVSAGGFIGLFLYNRLSQRKEFYDRFPEEEDDEEEASDP